MNLYYLFFYLQIEQLLRKIKYVQIGSWYDYGATWKHCSDYKSIIHCESSKWLATVLHLELRLGGKNQMKLQ